METNLLGITTQELLDKFGAGNHKPGSGSAAAFGGMLSAKLLATVISLTNEKKRRNYYKSALPKLLKLSDRIETDIFPALTRLFHEDAIQFGRTISAREARDNEQNLFLRNKLDIISLEELKESIEIPFTISKLCIELAEISEFVFDNAFQSARGDSHVALSTAVAGIAGCLSIINLNLISFGKNYKNWASTKIAAALKLKETYQKLNNTAIIKIEILETEVIRSQELYEKADELIEKARSKGKLSDVEIENTAKELQNLIWKYRDVIWNKNVPDHPANILRPDKAIKKVLDYEFAVTEKIGLLTDNGKYSNIAGLINQNEKIILISDEYDKKIQNFTAAHELGHALFHEQTVMHRDRPLNGSRRSGPKTIQEQQADKFASYFLMPKKEVVREFIELFGQDKFIINEQNSFDLIRESPAKLMKKTKNLRDLSLKIASTTRFANRNFLSLSELFNVSNTAMAIRLEELGLVEF